MTKAAPNPLDGLDLTTLVHPRDDARFLRALSERAEARANKFRPMTVPERLTALRGLHFRPYGLYVPDDPAAALALEHRLQVVGDIAATDARLAAYFALQDETERWAQDGVPGRWNGQQAVARSEARFRLMAWGRRGGKTTMAAYEAVAIAVARPRSVVWITAPIMALVARPWDVLVDVLEAVGVKIVSKRDSKDEKRIILENGSRFEGISLDDPEHAAGTGVDFAVVDEAAQITQEAWTRGVLPPLTDKDGHALLLSSHKGEESFIAEQIERIRDKGLTYWDVFDGGVTWDNFFMFPQGERTASIQQARAESKDPAEYLEQYGAIPTRNRRRIYPEYQSRIHLGDYPWNPNHPVILSVDPSSGGNPYAVAVLQDYGDVTHAVAEYYVTGAMAEDACAWADAQPWRANVQDTLIDSASPAEIERWARAGFPAWALPDKPQIETRFPIVRAMLRDPARFQRLYAGLRLQKLQPRGYTLEDWDQLPEDEQFRVDMEVELALSDPQLSPALLDALKRCSHFFVDRSCPHMDLEFRTYARVKHRDTDRAQSERAREYRNHHMDAVGYFGWVYKRYDYVAQEGLQQGTPFIFPEGIPPAPRTEPVGTDTPQERGYHFLAAMRAQYSRPDNGVRSYLVES